MDTMLNLSLATLAVIVLVALLAGVLIGVAMLRPQNGGYR